MQFLFPFVISMEPGAAMLQSAETGQGVQAGTEVSGKHNHCRFGSVGRSMLGGRRRRSRTSSHVGYGAQKQRLLREGRRRCPVDTDVFWLDTVFGSESVTTPQAMLIEYVASSGHLLTCIRRWIQCLLGFGVRCTGTQKGKGLHTGVTRSLEDGQNDQTVSCEQHDDDGGKAHLTLQIPPKVMQCFGKRSPRGPHGVSIAASFSTSDHLILTLLGLRDCAALVAVADKA